MIQVLTQVPIPGYRISMRLFGSIAKFTEEYGLIGEQDRILAAVSGGPDSVVLLHFLSWYRQRRRRPFPLAVAYVHHHLRKAADRECVFVERCARQAQVPFFRADVRLANKKSLEEAARLKRYRALADIARKEGYTRIAAGHTLDDQAETLLMRFCRGAGLRGLCGIHPCSQPIAGSPTAVIRPLLMTSRDDIERYLAAGRIPFMTDASNFSAAFQRNRLRRDILPLLERENPGAKRHLATAAFLLQEDCAFMDTAAEGAFDRLCQRKGKTISVDREGFLALPKAMQRMLAGMLIAAATGAPYRSRFAIGEICKGMASPRGEFLISSPRLRLVRKKKKVMVE